MKSVKKPDMLWGPTVESTSNSSTIFDQPLQGSTYTSSRRSRTGFFIRLALIWQTIPLSVIGLISSLGLLFIGFSFYASRVGNDSAELIFWIGAATLLLPVVIAIVTESVTRNQQVALLLLLGIAFYLVKVLYSPVRFTFLDELQHYRTANDIILSHHLFSFNPILTVSPYYPGLEIITDALVSLSGLSIFQAGILVIGVSRIILVLALYLFFEKVSQSSRIAGIGTLIYMANPHFLLFDAQYGYESLALPLAILALYLAVKHFELPSRGKLALGFAILLTIAAVVATHHVTSFLVVTILLLWAFFLGAKGIQVFGRFSPTWSGLFGYAAIIAWLAYVANQAIPYLTAPLTAAMSQLVLLILGQGIPRQLFSEASSSGPDDLFLRVLSVLSVLLILILLPYGLFKLWQKYRSKPLALILGALALTYPATLAMRYVSSWGLLVASRTAPYVFLGVGFVLAIGYVHFRWQDRIPIIVRSAFIFMVMVIYLGIFASSVSAWGLPVEYNQRSYTNSADNQTNLASTWTLNQLGPGNRFAAEPVMQWNLASFGEQRPITADADKIWEQNIFLPGSTINDIFGMLRGGRIRYLAIDYRNGSALWLTGSSASGENVQASSLPPSDTQALFNKFDQFPQVSRIYDGGDIVIYNVGVLSNVK